MLGFHRRTPSLIPVKDLAKYDKVPLDEEEELAGGVDKFDAELDRASSARTKAQQTQLTLVFIIFLAESLMASSLQSQLQMLVSDDDYCGNLSTSFLRSLLDCSYAFGGTAGVFWGYLSDRMGRRRVTLLGLWTMFACCLSMGFATSLASCVFFRFFAGFASSTIMVTTLTMIGDLSANGAERAKNVAKLPLVSLLGSVGPIVRGMVSESLKSSGAVWEKFPTLGSELACGGIVFLIAVSASILLKETLPSPSGKTESVDCEKAAFLSANDPESPSVSVVDYVRPESITINQFLHAPSLMVLLASFCLLSLHASTFDVLLPHLGHSSSQHGGMGIPCTYLGVVVMIVRGIAGVAILYGIPKAVERIGLLKLYRSVSLLLPAAYIVTPLVALVAACAIGFVPVLSMLSILVKHSLTGSASVLVALLVLNTTPDVFSTGTVVGMMSISSLFKALAVAVSGASYYLSNEFSVATTNFALWTCLSLFGAVGAAMAWFVRERPSLGQGGDFPTEVLCWETCFDAESESDLDGA